MNKEAQVQKMTDMMAKFVGYPARSSPTTWSPSSRSFAKRRPRPCPR